MTRLISNYVRMALSFSIGIYILRSLIAYDLGLYALYSIVTIGMATGVMLRESVRASLVSVISKSLVSIDKVEHQRGLHDALTVSIAVALINVLLSICLSTTGYFLNISDAYTGQFQAFMILRSLGYALVIFVIPYMNVLAFKNRMMAYNIFLLGERCVDLIVVELLLYLLKGSISTTPLVHAAYAYLVLNGLLSIFLILYTKGSSGFHLTFKPSKPSIKLFLSVKEKIKGSLMLVLNMAMYFRFSLLLVNMLFGEIIGAAYAVAVQVSSYLRQAIMGLVLGLDSRFSRVNRGQISNTLVTDMNTQVYVVLVPLILLCSLALLYIEYLIGLATSSVELDVQLIISMSSWFVVGVAVRGSSEVWMQLMIGDGRIVAFAKPILLFSLLTPLVTVFAFSVADSTGIVLIARWFVVSMCICHICIVPYVLSNIATQFTLTDLYRPIFNAFFVSSLALVYSLFLESKLWTAVFIVLTNILWCIVLISNRK